MKHPKLLIILSSLLAALSVVLFVTALFSVKDLTVEYSVYGKAEFDDVEEILEKYRKKSLIFLDKDKLEEEINTKTSFNVESVQKVYPSTVRIVLSSRQERFAIAAGDGEYYILDELFTVSEKRAEIKNKADALDNILLTFNGVDIGTLEVKTRLNVSESIPYGVIDKLIAGTASPRDHITAINLTDLGFGSFYMTAYMREGVVIEIRKVDQNTEVKVRTALERYFALSDKDKLSGKIICYEMDGGNVVAVYE